MTRIARRIFLFCLVGSVATFGVVYWVGWRESGSPDAYVPRPVGTLTFTKDIAPIVFENCAVCHRPGESAPFSLLSYRDVMKRAKQIAEVTESRFMPPWLPERGDIPFDGERLLTADQIGVIGQWMAEGATEGDPAELPPLPQWTAGWQLGKPDLVVTMPEPYTLPAEGTDVFRNFVIPIPVPTTRYVRTVELRPGNPKIVHHAVMSVDPTSSSKHLDEEDAKVGFDGMEQGPGARSTGHFLGWTPGKVPLRGTEEIAWRLKKGTDLVLQLHMLPSGKPEVIQSRIGLFFTDKPPPETPVVLRLGSNTIDIPAGKKDYVIEDTFRLPVDVEVLGIYPHAHYLCREMQGDGLLPDQTKQRLLYIKKWDFNWQDDYRYVKPVYLPKGTVLSMRYRYDNSDENVRNPHNPPRRVVYGPHSSDEMGDLWIQVLPRNQKDLAILKRNFADKDLVARAAGYEQQVRFKPHNANAHYNFGTVLAQQGKLAQAAAQYEQALHLKPHNANAHYNFGTVLAQQGKLAQAAAQYEQALHLRPDFANAYHNLGFMLSRQGRLTEAVTQYQQAIRIQPDFTTAHINLGVAYHELGKLPEAAAHYKQALRIDPDIAISHHNLGLIYEKQGNLSRAVAEYERTLTIEPNHANARRNLQRVRAMLRKND